MLAVSTVAALARMVPSASLSPEGIVQGSCAWLTRSPPLDVLLAHYHANQHPKDDCGSTRRIMLLDDFNEQTGLGFSFLSLHAVFLQALAENRTLLPSSAVLHGASWRWCDEGPKDFSCYFESWSSRACTRALTAWSIARGGMNASRAAPTSAAEPTTGSDGGSSPTIPIWDAATLGEATSSDRVVRLRFTDDPTQETIFRLYRRWMHCIPAIGRSWWWGATWDALLRFTPWVCMPIYLNPPPFDSPRGFACQYI